MHYKGPKLILPDNFLYTLIQEWVVYQSNKNLSLETISSYWNMRISEIKDDSSKEYLRTIFNRVKKDLMDVNWDYGFEVEED